MATVTSASFLNRFEQSYLRNNRRGGQKNLRCFPQCCPGGHQCSGFCGRAVRLSVKHSVADLVAVAEFVMRGKEPADLAVGTVHALDTIVEATRAKSKPLLRFIGGVDKQGDSVFHFRPTCWHYGWRSNKHATNKMHTLRVYLLSKDAAAGTATVLKIVDTPDFSLFSSKCLAKESYKRANPAVLAADLRRPAKRQRRDSSASPRTTTPQSPSSPPATPPPSGVFDHEDGEVTTVHTAPKSPVSVYDSDMLFDVPECSLKDILESLDVPQFQSAVALDGYGSFEPFNLDLESFMLPLVF